MKPPTNRANVRPSTLLSLVGQPLSMVGQVLGAVRAKAQSGPARPRVAGLEPLEPRTMLAANINYTYSAADILHFNDGDLQNNSYAIAIADVGGSDHLQIKAEDGSVLAEGVLANDGTNVLNLTGNKFLGDQISIDFTNLAGQIGADPRYDIQIITDGKGVVPLIGQDDKVTIVGNGSYQLHSLDLQTKEDITLTGAVHATGDISLKSSATDNEGLPGVDGLLFTADSKITISGGSADLHGANISLLAESTLTITNSNFSPGPVDIAFAIANADANIIISGGVINATGTLNVEAKNTVTSTLSTIP